MISEHAQHVQRLFYLLQGAEHQALFLRWALHPRIGYELQHLMTSLRSHSIATKKMSLSVKTAEEPLAANHRARTRKTP